MKKMVELFSGSGKMSRAFRREGYETLEVDFDINCCPDLLIDINSKSILHRIMDLGFDKPDVVWAGVDCTYFSRANPRNGGHFSAGGIPNTKDAKKAITTLENTLNIIDFLNPKFWFIENPGGNGAMKQLPMMKEYPSTEIYYCQYGGKTKKPTSLFGQFPSQFIPKTVCSHINHKEKILQMKGHLQRSEYPTDFCKDIVKSCKNSKLRSHTTLEEYL